jgi:hypothetical protein
MTKEETLYLPLLDAHLSEHEATSLFAMMDSVGRPSRFAIS